MSRAGQRLVALVATSLLLTLAGAAASGAAPTSPSSSPTSGREGADLPAAISLTALSPAVVTPTSTLVIKGTVTNTGATPIQNAVIRLLVHHAPLATRTQAAQWSSGAISDVGGRILNAAADLTVTLRPGASTRFTIKTPADQLGLFMDFASIGITLETLGDDGSPLGTHRVGLLRTYLTWQQTAAYTPLKISWLLPLTGGPTSATGGPPDATTLAGALVDGSRLRDVLAAVNAAPAGAAVSVAVDPALAADLRARSTTAGTSGTAGSTTPSSPSGTATPGSSPTSTGAPASTAEESVAAYLSALRLALTGRRVVQLPYGDPDLVGVADARGTSLLTAAGTAAGGGETSILARTLETKPIEDIAWPAGGWADQATIAAAPRIGINTLVLAASSRPPTLEQSTTPTGVTPVGPDTNAVLFDDVLSTLLGRTSSAPNAVLNQQRFLAETLATVYERPDRPRLLLVAPPRTFDPDPATVQRFFAAVSTAQWIQPATLTQLRGAQGQATVSDRQALPIPPATKRTQLPASQVTAVREVRAEEAQLGVVLADDSALEQARVDALRLVSTSWRGRVGTAALKVKALKSALTTQAGKVHILPLSTLNFLASDGNLTMSVANELGQEVRRIRVVVQPGNGRLVVVKQAPTITVEANRRTTIKVHVHAVASGLVPVTARILTPDGLQLGKTVTVQVHVRPTDTWAFWVIGVAAGLTFVIGLVRTLRRGRARPRLVAPEVEDLE